MGIAYADLTITNPVRADLQPVKTKALAIPARSIFVC